MNGRKNIGIMLAQPEEVNQSRLLKGISARASVLDIDCFVFAIEYKQDVSQEMFFGSSNIFELVNFDLLDAVIIVPDTIKDQATLDRILRLVKSKFKGVVLTADMELEGYPCLCSDDASAIEAVTDHLIDYHDCKVFDFMGGIKGHPHAIRRQEGFERSLKKHGIAFDEARLHHADFWYDKGDEVADDILNSGRPLPDAVVCASDTMAIALCEAFKKRGIEVPDRIRVTGYDALEESKRYNPSITSATMPAMQLGMRCIDYLHAVLNGEEYVEADYPPEVIHGHSCGCGSVSDDGAKVFELTIEDLRHDRNYRTDFLSTSNEMMSELIAVNDMEELLSVINWYTYQIRPFSDFMICLSEDWLGTSENETEYRKEGYHDNIHLRLIRQGESSGSIQDIVFDKEQMLPPEISDREKPAVYYFYPLHFFDRCFGYSVIVFDGDVYLPVGDCLDWMRYVCNGLECLRRRIHIRMIYEKLRVAAETDNSTGLLNRNAFNSYVEEIGQQSKKNTIGVLFIMADLNYLKTINDTFGHLAGDEALRTVAHAISSVCLNGERCFRFGGDEFMIIGTGDYTQERIDEMLRGIERYLERYNERSGNPYYIMASMGAYYAKVSSSSQIDGYIKKADKIMYEDKQRKKSERRSPMRVY